ncbi:MAG: hypothetical protein ABIR47_03085 [Candidatus Kapaibacterium sp.]
MTGSMMDSPTGFNQRRAGRSPVAVVKRMVLTFLLAAALAAIAIERRDYRAEPARIVMIGGGEPPRFPRSRPYRAHYRR